MFKLNSALCAILLFIAIAFEPSTPTTDRVNISSQGEQSNNESYHPAISDDGRYVTLSSHATNLVNIGCISPQNIGLKSPLNNA